MADKYPLANGNWSDAANWNDGTKPVTGDVVYADGKTVTIDEQPASDITLRNGLRSGGTTGGTFTTSTSMTITANIISVVDLTHQLLTITGAAVVSVAGNITHSSGASADGRYAIVCSSSGLLTITGTLTSSSIRNSGGCVAVNGSGGLAVVGPLIVTSNSPCLTINSAVSVDITGNITTSGAGSGVVSAAAFALTVTGNISATGGYGVLNSSTSVAPTVAIVGNITGVTANGVYLGTPSGHLTVTGNMINTGNVMAVFAARMRIQSGQPIYWQFYTSSGDDRRLYSADTLPGVPSAANVRSGTTYGPASELTGTLAVPPAGSVALGVPVDNTMGTAIITQAEFESILASYINPVKADTEAIIVDTNSIETKVDSVLVDTNSIETKVDSVLVDTNSIETDTSLLINLVTTLLKYSSNRTKIDNMTMTMTVYEDDGTTPLKIFNLKNFSGSPSITEIAERLPQ